MKKQIIWEDSTTYSRNNPSRIPSAWTMQGKRLRITVMTGHRDDPGEWVMSCHQLNINARRIGISKYAAPEKAQEKALKIATLILREMLAEIETP